MMDCQFDEANYQQGRRMFVDGASLRQALEFGIVNIPGEDGAFSFLLGFGDALLDQLRRPLVVAQGVEASGKFTSALGASEPAPAAAHQPGDPDARHNADVAQGGVE
jgi:hypothetical protein